jgi:hypothetical protein
MADQDILETALQASLSGPMDALDIMAKRACEYQTGLKWEGLSEHGRIRWRSAIHSALVSLGDTKPEFRPIVGTVIGGQIPRWQATEEATYVDLSSPTKKNCPAA